MKKPKTKTPLPKQPRRLFTYNDLYDYQKVGVDFLLTKTPAGKPHKLLADDPGLGKTYTACAAIKKAGHNNLNAKYALIICPDQLPIKNSWARAIADWDICQRSEVQILKTGKDEISPTAKVIIAGYALCMKDLIKRRLTNLRYDAVVVDEAQRLRGRTTKTSQAVLGSKAGDNTCIIARGYWKWLLSGTFAPNRPVETYPAIRALASEIIAPYTSWSNFTKYFCGGYLDAAMNWNVQGASHVTEFRERLRGFMLRREVDDVFDDLPEAIEHDIFIDLGDMEIDVTNTELATLRRHIGIEKLPYVLEYIEYALGCDKDVSRDDVRITDPQEREKYLVFTYHRDVSTGIVRYFDQHIRSGDIRPILLIGGCTPEYKQQAIDRFISDPDCRLLVAQINVGGEGIDGLQHVCNNVINAEMDWVAGGYQQQIGRVRRIGQTKPVNVYNLIAENTLDESVIASRRMKQRVLDTLLSSDGFESTQQKEESDMTIEAKLDVVIDLLRQLVGEQGGPAVEQPEAKQEQPKANGNGQAKVEAPKLDADAIRTAAAEKVEELGENDETINRIKAVLKECGCKDPVSADGVPKKNIAACIAGINALTAAVAGGSGGKLGGI